MEGRSKERQKSWRHPGPPHGGDIWRRCQPVERNQFQETIVALFLVGSWDHARSGTSAPFGQEVPGRTPGRTPSKRRPRGARVPSTRCAHAAACALSRPRPSTLALPQTINSAGPRGNPVPFFVAPDVASRWRLGPVFQNQHGTDSKRCEISAAGIPQHPQSRSPAAKTRWRGRLEDGNVISLCRVSDSYGKTRSIAQDGDCCKLHVNEM
ncbi:hypothetical protein B0T14DRAFT_334373 [Immersiella caudata]|uniref:Uncharacterized protein n=1 Tax=Immersiella caudata TaxID=314043 RepID=A0AA39TT29_9PEZI|nr:hypothetical protein B0T14DRAFT_334373 [Immersiella caudata]